MANDLVQRLHAALPQMRTWVDQLLAAHAAQARPVSGIPGFTNLASHCPAGLLHMARLVVVDPLPRPPLAAMGLPEFADFGRGDFDGITFRNTFFVSPGHLSESLCFHELVHVVQWSRLGFDRFMLAYAFGLLRFGYQDSPLEKMAYALQRDFDRGVAPIDLVGDIDHECDAIWKQAAPGVGGAG